MKSKSITNGHKNEGIESNQKPRGHEEDRASFPNQIPHKVSTIHGQNQLKREEHRGGGLENRTIHGHNTKAAPNQTQVKGYLYPRDRLDRYAGPVRPVGLQHPLVHDLI